MVNKMELGAGLGVWAVSLSLLLEGGPTKEASSEVHTGSKEILE